METRRVDETNLIVAICGDPQNTIACRLRFRRCNRDFFPQNTIHERRLTDIGATHQGYESSALVGLCHDLPSLGRL